MVSKKFTELLSLLDVLETVEHTHKFYMDIYGYKKHIHYNEFRLKWTEKVKFSNLLFIDEIECAPSYGFLVEENEYNDESVLSTGQNHTQLTIESITIEHFQHCINYNFIIDGEPKDIDIIADSNPFVAELIVTGCLNTAPFWKQSLYLGYLLFKADNILSSFMHLFITFEGLIRYHTSDTTTSSIHAVYKNYTGQNMSNYLNAYRKIRNQVMHGNENMASKLTIKDLEILIDTIKNLEVNKTSVNLTENTLAINEALLLS